MKRNTALRPWNHRDPSNPQLSPPAPLACAGWHTAHGDLLHAQGFPSGPFGSFTISDKPPLSEWSARGCANMEHIFWTNSEVPLLKQPSVLDHEQRASMGCFIPPSLQKHLYIWPSGWATLDQQPFSGRGSSSPTSLCWSRDFSTQLLHRSPVLQVKQQREGWAYLALSLPCDFKKFMSRYLDRNATSWSFVLWEKEQKVNDHTMKSTIFRAVYALLVLIGRPSAEWSSYWKT